MVFAKASLIFREKVQREVSGGPSYPISLLLSHQNSLSALEVP
jgi:hypothetical protein